MFKRNIVISFILLLIGGTFVSCNKDTPLVKQIPENPKDTVFKCNGFSELCNKRLDEVTTLMTHNSFNNTDKKFLVPNQDFSISRQLSDGVRGLMLDVYTTPNGPTLYHGVAQLGKEPLLSAMRDIKTFLLANPKEVITIIYENHCAHEEILQVIDSLELTDMVYIHNGTWSTLKEIFNPTKDWS